MADDPADLAAKVVELGNQVTLLNTAVEILQNSVMSLQRALATKADGRAFTALAQRVEEGDAASAAPSATKE